MNYKDTKLYPKIEIMFRNGNNVTKLVYVNCHMFIFESNLIIEEINDEHTYGVLFNLNDVVSYRKYNKIIDITKLNEDDFKTPREG